MPSPVTFLRAKALGGPQAANWHVVRNISELNKSRLRYAKPGRSWRSIPKRLRPDCHKGSVGDVGFRNVYGRMSWNEPSGTITGGCTTPSKGRFGHPRQLRTISVREAARLQTFPDSFIFPSPFIDRVCEMIGNAFPCKLAEVMASACVSALQRNGQG
jgi:DNA (cytosine-5)-methyltransferase 1